MDTQLDSKSIKNGSVKTWPLYFVVGIEAMSFALVFTLLPFHAKRFDLTSSMIGVLYAVRTVCQIIGAPVLGRLSDIIGRKRVILLSQAGSMVSIFMLMRAESVGELFISRTIDGLTAGNVTIASAMLTCNISKEQRWRSWSYISATVNVGLLVGPGVAWLFSEGELRHSMLFTSFVTGISVVINATLLEDTQQRHERVPPRGTIMRQLVRALQRPRVGVCLIQAVLFGVANSIFRGGIIIYATMRSENVDLSSISKIFIYTSLIGIGVNMVVSRLPPHMFKHLRHRSSGLLSLGIGYLLLIFPLDGIAFWAGVMMSGVGFALSRTSIMEGIGSAAGRTEQGVTLGIAQSVFAAGTAIGPIISGIVLDGGWRSGWPVFAALPALAGLVTERPWGVGNTSSVLATLFPRRENNDRRT